MPFTLYKETHNTNDTPDIKHLEEENAVNDIMIEYLTKHDIIKHKKMAEILIHNLVGIYDVEDVFDKDEKESVIQNVEKVFDIKKLIQLVNNSSFKRTNLILPKINENNNQITDINQLWNILNYIATSDAIMDLREEKWQFPKLNSNNPNDKNHVNILNFGKNHTPACLQHGKEEYSSRILFDWDDPIHDSEIIKKMPPEQRGNGWSYTKKITDVEKKLTQIYGGKS